MRDVQEGVSKAICKYNIGSFMVWGCILTSRVGHLVKVDGNMSAER